MVLFGEAHAKICLYDICNLFAKNISYPGRKSSRWIKRLPLLEHKLIGTRQFILPSCGKIHGHDEVKF